MYNINIKINRLEGIRIKEKMSKTLKRYIKKNPYQAGIIAYNFGIFAWLQANALTLMGKYNITVPPVLQGFGGGVIRFLSNYTPLTWLLLSMLLAWAFKTVGIIVKWVIIIVLGIVAYYLVKGYGIAVFS